MDRPFAVRPVRQRDLARILEIQVASFAADAYDRNLFAEYARKCGGLFLVAERGTKVCAYSIAAISPDRLGTGTFHLRGVRLSLQIFFAK